MARLNVYVPDDLAERARQAGLNISALTQAAIAAELELRASAVWLDTLPCPARSATHEAALNALDAARGAFGADDD
jgi:post-segregation antitoxin (ccd killing protein)